MEDKILGHLRNLTKIKSIPFPLPPPSKKKDEFCVLCKFYRDVVTIFFEGGGGRWWEVFVHKPELAKSGVL